MLGFVQNLLGPKPNPIGITFGADTLRVAQVMQQRDELRICAAASREVPHAVRDNPKQRLEFFTNSLREITASGGFKGKQVVLGLPSASLAMMHLRLPPMDEAMLRKAVAFESNGKLPFPPAQAMIRHIIAGEVYDKQEQKLETILMASPKAAVEEYLAAAGRAKLDVVGLCAEPLAMVECFTRLGRRAEDTQAVTLYLDIGASGTRVLIALNRKVLFARSIGIGGDEFNKAVAKDKGVGLAEARLTRNKLGAAEADEADTAAETNPATSVVRNDNSFNFGGGITAVAEPAPLTVSETQTELTRIFTVIRQPLDRLVSEIEMCRRYHEATFPTLSVQRIVFVGGEARQRSLCASIAQKLGLPANVWDPVARLPRDVEHAMELGGPGLNPKNRLPDWTVVVGLSMGVTGESQQS